MFGANASQEFPEVFQNEITGEQHIKMKKTEPRQGGRGLVMASSARRPLKVCAPPMLPDGTVEGKKKSPQGFWP